MGGIEEKMNLKKEIENLNSEIGSTLDEKAAKIVVAFAIRTYLAGFFDGMQFVEPSTEKLQEFLNNFGHEK